MDMRKWKRMFKLIKKIHHRITHETQGDPKVSVRGPVRQSLYLSTYIITHKWWKLASASRCLKLPRVTRSFQKSKFIRRLGLVGGNGLRVGSLVVARVSLTHLVVAVLADCVRYSFFFPWTTKKYPPVFLCPHFFFHLAHQQASSRFFLRECPLN